jgi:hypothetical protein
VTRQANVVALALGCLALLAATAAGWSDAVNAILVSPPPVVRFLLGTTAALVGIVLVLRSADRLSTSTDPPDLVRAVRIVFLAVAAFAAAGGWLVGSPVPIVAALVIAGVDVVETTFLLLVSASRPRSR